MEHAFSMDFFSPGCGMSNIDIYLFIAGDPADSCNPGNSAKESSIGGAESVWKWSAYGNSEGWQVMPSKRGMSTYSGRIAIRMSRG